MLASSSAVRLLTVPESATGQRIDNFLTSRLKGLPKSRLYRALRSGEVRVNKKRVKADYRVQAGDEIRIPPLRLSAPTQPAVPSEKLLQELANSIIYEDKDLILLNKPSGVAAHGGSGIHFGVIEALRHLYPKLKFLELAHRLDRDTSGCLLLAKKPSVLKALHEQFANGKVEKTYLALVAHAWHGQERRVNAPLQKQTLLSGERVVRITETGKAAETLFSPLKCFANATLIRAKPLTGRTHQIRVHAAHIGHPICGDPKYARSQDHVLPVKHLLLHAASLRFVQPASGEIMAIGACLDKHFAEVLRQLC